MAEASEDSQKIEPSPSMDDSPSRRVSDAASASGSSSGVPSPPNDPFDRSTPDDSNSLPSPSRHLEIQVSLRSEEYRQLFHLPPEEVLLRDFNCALQENFLLQGHMYLFVHYICFYSNLFGFETKKIIPLHEVTSVRRAKTAAIFPTAIDIIAGGKKYFFTSFLSRDEAFKLINDGWLLHRDGAKAVTDQQGSKSELNSQENEIVIVEKLKTWKQPEEESDSIERNLDVSISEGPKFASNGEAEILLKTSEVQDNTEEGTGVILNTDSTCFGNSLVWEQDDSDAPKVPKYYARVAESKFLIKVEEFFNLFFSDDAVDFLESFHRKCGDKEFRCTSWHSHDKLGHARDVSFQHPIKLYFGARFGSCQEVQKFRVYKNSHLVVETSQEINDVPYGDYFHVEGLWDVERDDESEECCILRVYTNVAFSKKTMWKGKIVQSTVEECRDAYAIWIDFAHELLKQKNVEKEEGGCHATDLIPSNQFHLERQANTVEHLEQLYDSSDLGMAQTLPESMDMTQVGNPLQGSFSSTASIVSLFRESVDKFCSYLKSQFQVPLFLVITLVAIILLMQVSIVVLLSRTQQVHVMPQAECMSSIHSGVSERAAETMALLEKRIEHLKADMRVVETLLETMRREHTVLKLQLKDLEFLRKQQR